eukprot:1266715-Karenia_brevis.AAC.1
MNCLDSHCGPNGYLFEYLTCWPNVSQQDNSAKQYPGERCQDWRFHESVTKVIEDWSDGKD